MEALITETGQDPHPGPHESWRELAEHAAEHDQVTEHPATRDPGRYARYAAWRRAELGLG
jgi:hypothetical protein